MKMLSKFYVFVSVVLVSALLGLVAYTVTSNAKSDTNVIDVNGVNVKMPIKLTDRYEVVNAKLNQYTITVYVLDKEINAEIESTLPSDDLEEFVCNFQFYSNGVFNQRYDCSTEESTVYSMIKEVGIQTVEVLNEGL